MAGRDRPRWRAARLLTLVAVPIAGALLAALMLPWILGPGLVVRSNGNLLAPLPVELGDKTPAGNSVVLAADGSLITYFYRQNRTPVGPQAIADVMEQALVDIEDSRFYEHRGLDVEGTARALVRNLMAGSVQEGGSTITQQLVKQTLLQTAATPEDRLAATEESVGRKLREARLALALEQQYDKAEILTRYLNIVYFGRGAYGLQAAAERYYETDVDKLTLGQAILLAGLIRNPVYADPYNNPEDARGRRDVIIDRMARLNHISPEQAVELKAETLPQPRPQEDFDSKNYFTRHVVDQLLNDPKYLGGTDAERNRLVFRGGLDITTTLVPGVQALAEQSIADTLPANRGQFNAALVSVEPASGAVRAAVSGLDFAEHKIDMITGKGRQTGSSFKMLTLMAALEHGEIPADTILASAPCVIPDPKSIEGKWDPKNVEGQAGGVLTLTDATINSVNCAFARLIKLVGPEKVVDVARRMGIKNADLQPFLSLTLGSVDVTPLEMATAYATLANDGEYHEPYFIDRIEDRDGKVLYKTSNKGERAVSVTNARTVTQILTQVVARGTGTAAQVPRWQVAGKTGSTDNEADAWFVGVTPKLATAVWMGAPAGYGIPMRNVGPFPIVYGGTYPAMIYGAFMRQFLAGQTVVDFAAPDRVPNQRAPKFLQIDGELNPTAAQRAAANQNGQNIPDNNNPSGTVPRPQIIVPDPVIPQIPIITIPAFPDATVPRVTVPPVVDDDTTPTTRRNRG